MTKQQLLLDIHPAQIPSLDNFVVGENAQLIAHLNALSDNDTFDQIYLWGTAGSGRSHLLRGALARAQEKQRPVAWVDVAMLDDTLPAAPGSLIIIDDVEALSAEAQITLFRTFNAARLTGLALLLAGSEPPLRLALREDLRTRIGATLVYEVKPLSERDKAAALSQHARERGMSIDQALIDSLIDYLLRHGRRDLPSLLAVLDLLNLASLEQKRPLTLPLLREVMQESLELDY